MVESITSKSLLWHSICRESSYRDLCIKGRSNFLCRLLPIGFHGREVVCAPSLPRLATKKLGRSVIKALAVELTKEASARRENRIPQEFECQKDTRADKKRQWWPPDNKADNPSLHNPLIRQERMGCGWFLAIFEWEGVLLEDHPEHEKQAWLVLAEEEGASPPSAFILRRIEGMKNEQAISEVLCWTRNPAQLGRMATRKEEIYRGLQGGMYRLRAGSQEFVNTLVNYKIPMALVSTHPKSTLETAIRTTGIDGSFNAIVAADDVHRGKPDPEMFLYAAQLLSFIPERCIVFGNSNQTVEASRDARMKCVAVASKHPIYELGAADMVVRQLDELSVVDLKNLADMSADSGFGEPELEEQENDPYTSSSDDIFW